MPWKESRIMDQRLQFLSSYQKEEMSVADLCREYGISRPIGYRWINRYCRTRVVSQRQLPTDHDNAVSTREYQLDQSSPLPASAAADPVLVRKKTTSAA
jgi:hypothetical protein